MLKKNCFALRRLGVVFKECVVGSVDEEDVPQTVRVVDQSTPTRLSRASTVAPGTNDQISEVSIPAVEGSGLQPVDPVKIQRAYVRYHRRCEPRDNFDPRFWTRKELNRLDGLPC